jgi:hypothetical protein
MINDGDEVVLFLTLQRYPTISAFGDLVITRLKPLVSNTGLQVREIVVNLLWTQLPKARTGGTLNTVVSEKVICWGPDNSDLYGLSAHLSLDL